MPSFVSFRRLAVSVAFAALVLPTAACSSTASVQSVRTTTPPPAATRTLAVSVDKDANDERGEATTLERALVNELRGAGYRMGEGGLRVRARVVHVHRGSTIVNVTSGLGSGSDSADVAVRVEDPAGKELLAFVVRGRAVDKRYRDLHQVLAEDVPRAIREQLERSSQ